MVAVSLALYLAERGAEFAVILHYFLSGQCLWAGWTLALLLPGCLVQALSFAWFRSDGRPRCFALGLLHLLQLGILKRHADALWRACGGRRDGPGGRIDGPEGRELLMKQGELFLLRLLETLLQALPHLLLQIYIYLTLEQTDAYAVISALFALLSLSWALVSYSRFMCLLKPGHLSMPWASLLCQLLWRMGMIGTRAMVLVVFTRVYHYWVFAVAGAHWLVMSFWLVAQQTDVISRPCYWRLFNVLVGAAYVFCFINVKHGRSRYRVAIFYAIMLLENCVLLLLATDFLQAAAWSDVKLSVAVLSGFLIGCAALMIYYTLLHPKSTEISQSFCKTAQVSRVVHEKTNESPFSSGCWNLSSGKEAERTSMNEELKPSHHWLLVRLAMKTGDLLKINAAFGDSGFADVVSPGRLVGAPIFLRKVEPPRADLLESEQLLMGKLQAENIQCSEGPPYEPSTYVTLRNIRVPDDNPETGTGDMLLSVDGHDGKLSTEAKGESDSQGRARDSATFYFSANMDAVLSSAKDLDSILDSPDPPPLLAVQVQEPTGLEAAGKEEFPAMCVSPILSLAANSNFQRSVALDVSNLTDESTSLEGDSELVGTEEPLGRRGFRLLTGGLVPPSVKGRLVKEDKPCFTSTPKAQAAGPELGLHAEAKARRKLGQLVAKV